MLGARHLRPNDKKKIRSVFGLLPVEDEKIREDPRTMIRLIKEEEEECDVITDHRWYQKMP